MGQMLYLSTKECVFMFFMPRYLDEKWDESKSWVIFLRIESRRVDGRKPLMITFTIKISRVQKMQLYHLRKTRLPPFSIVLLAKFFFLGFLGFTGQYLGYLGVAYSNPTLGSAMSNLSPASTFFLAILFRMEKLKLRSLSSQAKIIGALVSIAGALVVVLYNGPMVITGQDENLRLPTISNTVSGARSNWILGGALLAGCYLVSSIWYIFQGIIGTGFGIMIHTWGLHVKGPVYVALFKPLSIAIAAIFGVLFLGDDLYLGSVIGSVVITMGFYTVMWGKMKEDISNTSDDNLVESSTTDVIIPLLKH